MERARMFLERKVGDVFVEAHRTGLRVVEKIFIDRAINNGDRETMILLRTAMESRVQGIKGRAAHLYYFELSRLNQSLDLRGDALANMEQALLTQADYETPRKEFPDYVDRYASLAHAITQQEAVPQLRGRNRQEAIDKLYEVFESTDRVLEQFPNIDVVDREQQVARLLLVSAGQRLISRNQRTK